MKKTAPDNSSCPREELIAYLDGELGGSERASFERHMAECKLCAASLEEQSALLSELEFALGREPELELPRNFAEVVAARAQSDMSGVRARAERARALRLCALLTLICFALLGGAALSESVLKPLSIIGRYATTVLGFFWHALYDLSTGLAVILRAVSRRFIFDSDPLSLLLCLLLVAALLLLPRLILNYHRAHHGMKVGVGALAFAGALAPLFL